MINLLPPDRKAEMRAGLVNTQLRRLIIIFVVTLLTTTAVFGAGLSLTLRNKLQAEQTKSKQTAAAKQYAKTKTAAEAYGSNLAAAKTILAGQISYTSLLIDITNALPEGTSLASLAVDNASFGKPFTLNARAADYPAALQLKQALSEKMITIAPGKPPVHLLTGVSLVDVQNNDNGGDYALSVSISGILTRQPPIINEEGAFQ